MFKVLQYLFFFCAVLSITSCKGGKSDAKINFSSDSASIIINNIDAASFLQAKKIYDANPDTVNFVSVLIIPSLNDSLQLEERVKGTIKLNKNEIIFMPTIPFVKGNSYLVENYINAEFITVKKMINGGVKSNLTPQQQILTR
ncbi:hypothetical protein EZJ43_03290 [Pedobacter changchengzhani]|uniref:Uncharacterized protein n=1 Tax=Pedobacter changchengzhani TaxID=2529274 RepID=A0A4R5MNK3_9SPHI|nr:hypothetical protein [Pedobacter changchengzhani]TDG37156.1 hypothetical protein EZJ43_03290 [Pedobacter changchengzhani]